MNNSEIPENEISLNDLFLKPPVLKAEKNDSEVKQEPESMNMSSVLVDDQLMAELKAIPDRFGFKIGDVADLLGIKQYVLRYWEQEFDLLKPKKASNNQRMYTKKDVENAFLIRKLLYRDKFSIEGARQALKDVKFVVKKEKAMNTHLEKIEKWEQSQSYMQKKVNSFIEDIRRTKAVFLTDLK